jgi:hypothetical protein
MLGKEESVSKGFMVIIFGIFCLTGLGYINAFRRTRIRGFCLFCIGILLVAFSILLYTFDIGVELVYATMVLGFIIFNTGMLLTMGKESGAVFKAWEGTNIFRRFLGNYQVIEDKSYSPILSRRMGIGAGIVVVVWNAFYILSRLADKWSCPIFFPFFFTVMGILMILVALKWGR